MVARTFLLNYVKGCMRFLLTGDLPHDITGAGHGCHVQASEPERRGVASATASAPPDYLERALQAASRDASARLRPARVLARFREWCDATIHDEIEPRSREWWDHKLQELLALASREVPAEGFEL